MTRTYWRPRGVLMLTSAVIAGARASRFELGGPDRTSLQESLPAIGAQADARLRRLAAQR